MKIRTITYFLDPDWPINNNALQKAGEFNAAAHTAFEALGYEIQTSRLATIPFPYLLPMVDADNLIKLAQDLEITANAFGFQYLSLGPALPERIEDFDLIPTVLQATKNVFLTGLMSTQNGDISLPAVRMCAEIIHQAASITPDGFTNLRFAALANVPTGAPFFPAAYHSKGEPSFALGTEAADLAVEVLSTAHTLKEARLRLIGLIEEHAKALSFGAWKLSRLFDISFGGIDFTLAPFPTDELSFGNAIEQMGVPAIGLHGSLAAAAFLTDTLDRASFQRAGFNGLFMPVLEDATLAARAAEGTLSVKDLLLYSTVCGTGLDTVPLPGDTSPEQLYAILLDLAALAHRLNKPLTARLMPLPGKSAGDPTDFDFDYFANSRVMELEAKPLGNLLTKRGNISLGR